MNTVRVTLRAHSLVRATVGRGSRRVGEVDLPFQSLQAQLHGLASLARGVHPIADLAYPLVLLGEAPLDGRLDS